MVDRKHDLYVQVLLRAQLTPRREVGSKRSFAEEAMEVEALERELRFISRLWHMAINRTRSTVGRFSTWNAMEVGM